MEIIIITKISDDGELKTAKGDAFWGVELKDGRKATVWDAEIAGDIRVNLNIEAEAEVKQQGTFLNIRKFKGDRKGEAPQRTDAVEQSPLSTGTFDQKGKLSPSEADAEMRQASTMEFEAKSSVKLKKNSKGVNWEIKVVKDEEGLIMGLMEAAVVAHKALEVKFPEVIKPKE